MIEQNRIEWCIFLTEWKIDFVWKYFGNGAFYGVSFVLVQMK